MGVQAVIEQAEALLRLLIDMGHDPLPIHGKHGVGGGIHDILQYIHPAYLFSHISAAAVSLCAASDAVYAIILHDCRMVFNGNKIKARLGGP